MTIFEKVIEAIIWILCIALVVLGICAIIMCVTGNAEITQEEADFIIRTNTNTTIFNATGVCSPIQ